VGEVVSAVIFEVMVPAVVGITDGICEDWLRG
jgi:hypothetical protein